MLLMLLALSASACGDEQPTNPDAVRPARSLAVNQLEYRQGVATLKHLDEAIACGKLDTALNLFDAAAIIEVHNPPHLMYVDPIYLWQLSGYRVDPLTGAVAAREVKISYSGEEWIKAYLNSLTTYQYHSEYSSFKPDGDLIVWSAYVGLGNYHLDMEFDATIVQNKIQALLVKNSNLITF